MYMGNLSKSIIWEFMEIYGNPWDSMESSGKPTGSKVERISNSKNGCQGDDLANIIRCQNTVNKSILLGPRNLLRLATKTINGLRVV